jgi:hypothetical protein
MAPDNLFSTLGKYDASRTAENYLTESFAYLLGCLLERDPAFGIQVVNRLCGIETGFVLEDAPKARARTQQRTGKGIPDLVLSAPGKLVYVEVKDESPASATQLAQYREHLDGSGAAFRRLVLLTRFATEIAPSDDGPHRCVRWFEVYDWLALHGRTGTQVPEDVHFLVRQFAQFLEVQGMTVERIGWELMPGLDALMRFRLMLDAAIDAAGLKGVVGSMRAGSYFYGCSIEQSKFWCGLEYRRPLTFWLQRYRCPAVDLDVLKTGPYELKYTASGKEGYALNLEDEQVAFFASTKENQLARLADFIKKAYEAFREAEAAAAAKGASVHGVQQEAEDESL